MKMPCLRPPLQWLRCALYPGRNGQAIHFCPYSYLAVRRLFCTSSRCLMVGLMLSVQHDVREFIFLEVFRVADSIIDPDRSPAYHRSPRGNLAQSSKFCFCPTRTSIGPGWPPSRSTLLIKLRTHHKVTVPVYKNHHAVRPPYCESKTAYIWFPFCDFRFVSNETCAADKYHLGNKIHLIHRLCWAKWYLLPTLMASIFLLFFFFFHASRGVSSTNFTNHTRLSSHVWETRRIRMIGLS